MKNKNSELLSGKHGGCFAKSEKNECFEEVYLMADIAETLKFHQNNFPSNGNMLVKKLILNTKT